MKNDLLNYLRTQHKYIDKTFWAILIILVIFSAICLFSTSSTLIREAGGNILQPILSHLTGLLFGIVLAYGIQFLPSWMIRMVGYVGLAFSLLCVLLTFSPLGVTINGETRWVRLFGVTFQPSEIAKITLVIVISDLLSRIKTEENRKKLFWITLGLMAFTCVLILPTNLSTALLIGIVIVLLMYLARIPILWLLGVIAVPAAIMIAGYFYVDKVYVEQDKHMNGFLDRAETWVKRVNNMFESKDADPSTFRFNDDYQANMAHVAVANGGLWGVGPGNSWAKEKLPMSYSDFIFAIICEEMGLWGSMLLIFIYLAILFRACYASSKYADYSAMLMMMGLALMLVMQAFISMEVSVGLGPVTGQTLPIISHGKTSSIVFCLYFGIMMAVSREQNEKRTREEAAIQESADTVPDIVVE